MAVKTSAGTRTSLKLVLVSVTCRLPPTASKAADALRAPLVPVTVIGTADDVDEVKMHKNPTKKKKQTNKNIFFTTSSPSFFGIQSIVRSLLINR